MTFFPYCFCVYVVTSAKDVLEIKILNSINTTGLFGTIIKLILFVQPLKPVCDTSASVVALAW